MEIGFDIEGAYGVIRPDRNTAKTSTPRVLRATFGDGYEQRMPDGINNITQSFSVAFNNRDKEEIDAIISFLDSKAGYLSFDYTYPDSASGGEVTTVKVVCDTYNITYTNSEYYGCTATFRRVYEP